MKIFLYISLLIISVASVYAQGDEPRTVRAKTVRVDARRGKPSSVALTSTVIDSTTIARYAPLTMVDFLTANTPLFIKSYGIGSQATASFRGTDAAHTQVEWNGLNINSPMMGQVDFSMLPVWMIDNVELLHGGSSLREGGGALGGMVVIGSDVRWNRPFYGAVAGGLGSFGLRQGMGSLGGGNDKVQVRGRYIYEQAQNDFTFVNNAVPPFEVERLRNANYNKQGATIDVNTKLGGGHFVDVNGWFHNANRNLPPVISYQGKGRIENQHERQWRGVVRWRWYGENMRSNLSFGFTSDLSRYYLESLTDLGSLVNYDNRSTSNSYQLKYRLEWDVTDKTTLSLLVNARENQVRTADYKTDFSQNFSRTDLGVSLSAYHRFNSTVALYGLLRYENPAVLIPSAGIEVTPLDNFTIRLNTARNYHKPTLNDLYWIPGGNPELRPEKGFTTDLNLAYRLSQGRWTTNLEGTTFLSVIDDWIIWQPSEFYYWRPQNLKQVLSRGVELRVNTAYNAGKFHLNIAANYAYTRTTNQKTDRPNDETIGKQLIYIPQHKANLFAEVGYGKLYFTWNQSFIGSRETTSTNSATLHSLPCYLLSDITFGFRGWGVEVAAKVNNLFDESYQAILWRPMPGRNYSLNIRYTF